MILAAMQPYLFPYISYFQLIQAADVFSFHDDVNYIKGGWINRNRIIRDGESKWLTVPLIKSSQNKLINEIAFDPRHKDYQKLIRTIEHAYRQAPYFSQVYPLLETILGTPTQNIAMLAQKSVTEICAYLEIKSNFKTSSVDFSESQGLEKSERLIEMCKKVGANHYINAINGVSLYDKKYFEQNGVKLNFLQTQPIEYKQFDNGFMKGQSIIDVLMFNDVPTIQEFLGKYILI